MPDQLFPFSGPFGDARLAELRLLSWVDGQDEAALPPLPPGPWRDLLVALVSADLITTFSYQRAREGHIERGAGSAPIMASQSGIAGESLMERATVVARTTALECLYRGEGASVRVTHGGRVRVSELKQALRSAREREPFGILWDARHWRHDLQVALIDATRANPLSIAYIDMNGLKALNDRDGHDAGDRGLQMYFEAVSSVLTDDGQAYRLGGDEVLALLPGLNATKAAERLEVACRRLMRDSIAQSLGELLSMSIGIVAESDALAVPDVVRSAADRVQYRAKEESKRESPRPSVIAVGDQLELKVIRPSDESRRGATHSAESHDSE